MSLKCIYLLRRIARLSGADNESDYYVNQSPLCDDFNIPASCSWSGAMSLHAPPYATVAKWNPNEPILYSMTVESPDGTTELVEAAFLRGISVITPTPPN